jgi:hypothetical protein
LFGQASSSAPKLPSCAGQKPRAWGGRRG